jgi:hypothetical protein
VSAPQLPPPPGAAEWGEPAPTDATPGRTLLDRPAWRQGRPGWALVHLAIASGIAVVGFFVAFIPVAAAGRTDTDLDRASNGLMALGMLAILASSFVGWLLFAYLGGSLGRRWIALGAIAGGGWIVAVVLFLSATS